MFKMKFSILGYIYVILILLFFTAEMNGHTTTSSSLNSSLSWGHVCQIDSECSGKLLCTNNTCKCPYGYQWSSHFLYSYSCQPFNKVDCYYDKQCQDADPNQACYEIFGHCHCKIGYYLNTTNLRCMKEHTKLRNDYCQVDDQCQESMICLNNTCKCDFGYTWMEYSNSCAYNGECYSDIQCQDVDPNRSCVNNSCICKEDYYLDYADICKKGSQRNENCTYDFQCKYGQEYGICVNSRCKCSKNQFISLNNKTCLSTTQNCNYDWQCQDMDDNKVCDNNLCRCKDGFIYSSTTNKCKSLPNQPCSDNNDCTIKNSFCNKTLNEPRCACKPKYVQHFDECDLKLCYIDSDCLVNGITDVGLICNYGVECVCKSNFHYNEDLNICVEYSNLFWCLLMLPIIMFVIGSSILLVWCVMRKLKKNRINHNDISTIDVNINQRQNQHQLQQIQHSQSNQQHYEEDLPPSYEEAINQSFPVNGS